MSTTVPEHSTSTPSAVPQQPAAPVHPSQCPAWCKDRHAPLRHHFGPTSTAHWGPQYKLANPAAFPDQQPVMLRAELFRLDEGVALGEVGIYISGETDVELTSPEEADILIGDMEAALNAIKVMRCQAWGENGGAA